MQRIAVVEVDFGGNLYEFKLYNRTLLAFDGIITVEFTEKINSEVFRVYEMKLSQHKLKEEIVAEAQNFADRINSRIQEWEDLADLVGGSDE